MNESREINLDFCMPLPRHWRDAGCHALAYWRLASSRFSQPADSTALPSRDSLGVYHAISRLLAQFETFRAELGRG